MDSINQSLKSFKTKGFELAWITVKNFDEAVKFYTEVLGLEQKDYAPEYKWAEFEGKEGGARLGICEACEESPIKPGENAVVSFTVDNLDEACKFLKKQNVEFVGEVQEIPGHVRMQLIKDSSGNYIHICQLLS